VGDGAAPTPGTPRLLRALNDRAALELLLSHGPLTRARLVQLTGLSKPTASQLLARLESTGLVRAAGTDEGGRGPNAQLYAVNGGAGLVAGVDMTPRRASVRLVDLAGTIRAEVDVDLGPDAGTDDRAPAEDLRRALAATQDVTGAVGSGTAAPDSVVVGVQGVYDRNLDALAYAGHLPGWSRPGLLPALERAAGCPVAVENDVNLAAVAEQAGRPAAPPAGCEALLWMGDGLGLAIHLGGVLHRGATGGAGEIGDMHVSAGPVGAAPGPATVALQDLVGGPAVLRLARAHGLRARTASAAVERAVVAANERPGNGGPTASSGEGFLRELADRVAVGLATIVAVLDPELVVLSGPVGRAGADRLPGLVAEALYTMSPMRPQVRASSVAGNPVLAGACALALGGLRDALFSTTTRGTTTTDARPANPARATGVAR
jgi:predicted NBD/HSP70 family sugar kinase